MWECARVACSYHLSFNWTSSGYVSVEVKSMKVKKGNLRDKPRNSSMINNEEELKRHSKIMEQMSTNQEIIEQDKIPDPQQDEKKR